MMKLCTILLAILLSLFAVSAFAQTSPSRSIALDGLYEHGIYIGGQLSYFNLHNSHAEYPLDEIFFPILNKTGSRLYIGYRFNDFVAAEMGYNWITNDSETGGIANQKRHSRMSAFDLLGKGILPFNRYFSGFAKAGLARVHQNILDSYDGGGIVLYKSDKTEFLPLLGLGFTYHMTTRFAADLGWTHFFGHSDVKDIDMYGLGVNYTF